MKVLIVKTSALGDIIQTYPVIRYIKQHFPHAQIDWAVEERCAELVQKHPLIRKTVCINTKQWRKFNEIKKFRQVLRDEEYDVVFDLQGNIKSGIITSQARSKNKVGFGLAAVPEWPNLLFTNRRYNPPKNQNIREDYLHLVKSYFLHKTDSVEHKESQTSQEPLLCLSLEEHESILRIMQNPLLHDNQKVMVCPGSAWRNKQMTLETLENFLGKVQKLLNCVFIFVWGTSEEHVIAQHLSDSFPGKAVLIDRLPLPALQNLMTHMDLIIAMDSLPLHLAGTTNTPTFSIFGASSGQKYHPLGRQNQFFQGSCPYGRVFEKRCPVLRTCKTGACIRSLTAAEVFNALNEAMNISNSVSEHK